VKYRQAAGASCWEIDNIVARCIDPHRLFEQGRPQQQNSNAERASMPILKNIWTQYISTDLMGMSAFEGKADIDRTRAHVRF
jgi:hypothetical protein